jgi:3-oxoacyl-[acyl-carrier protein] reductase
MHIRFEGQTVIVTGAAHGIGRALCREFARAGAQVWACDVLTEALAATQAACHEIGGWCEARTVDVTDPSAGAAFVAEAARRVPLSVLINNAGGVLGQVGRPLEAVTPTEWNAILAVNVSAAFYMAQAAAPSMKAAQRGRIINVSSGAGLGVSLTGIQAYAAAKAALINLTRQLAHELGAWHITVNSIAPGFILSNPNTQRQWESYGEVGQHDLISRIALRRLGQPEDIAHTALFLASEYAAWLTGQVIAVDGGK